MRLQNDRIIMNLPGATTEVATLKQALTKAEDKAAKERTEREKHEARVGKVQQELQDAIKKCESLEHDSKTQDPNLRKPSRVHKMPRPKPIRPFRRYMRPRR